MSLTPQQVTELKLQLQEQIKHLPEDQKAQAQEQIDSMSSEALEALIKQQQGKSKQAQKGVFRAIVDKEIPSKIIDENKDAIAVLDIRPISKGHTIIIPKKVVSDAKILPNPCFNLAKKVAKRISSKLKSKGSEIQTQFSFGEIIINVIPIYEERLSINSPRKEASDKELEQIEKILKIVKKTKIIRIKKQSPESNLIKLNRKIP